MITLAKNKGIFPLLKLNKLILTTRAMAFAAMALMFGLAQPDVLKAIENKNPSLGGVRFIHKFN